jgi:hypothetical protein
MKTVRCLALILLLPVQLLAQESIQGGLPATTKRLAIALVPFEGRGISANEAMTLSDRLRAEVMACNVYDVMERAEMEKILKEQAFQLTGACSDISCIVQVGQLIAVTRMIGGSISRVGSMYTVESRLINVETGSIEKSVVEDYGGGIEELLTKIMAKVARKLTGLSEQQSYFSENADLYVRSEPPGGMIIIDGQPTGLVTPATLRRLVAASHKVRVETAILAKDTTLTLKANMMGTLNLHLKKRTGLLKIEGAPPGAAIYLNEGKKHPTKLGVVPLSRDLEFGPYSFTVKAKGYHPQPLAVFVNQEKDYKLDACPARKSRVGAGALSLFLPGRGQTYSDRKGMGKLYFFSVLLNSIGLSTTAIVYHNVLKDYDEDKDTYLASENSAEAAANYEAMEDAHEKASSNYKLYRTFLNIEIGLWAWNVLDAMILFPGNPKVGLEPATKAEGSVKPSASLTFEW